MGKRKPASTDAAGAPAPEVKSGEKEVIGQINSGEGASLPHPEVKIEKEEEMVEQIESGKDASPRQPEVKSERKIKGKAVDKIDSGGRPAAPLPPELNKGKKRTAKDKLSGADAVADETPSGFDMLEGMASAQGYLPVSPKTMVESGDSKEGEGKSSSGPEKPNPKGKRRRKSSGEATTVELDGSKGDKKLKIVGEGKSPEIAEMSGDSKDKSPAPEAKKRRRKRGSGKGTSSTGEATMVEPNESKGDKKLKIAEEGNHSTEITEMNVDNKDKSPAPVLEELRKTLFVGDMPYNYNADQIITLLTSKGINVSDCMFPCHGGSTRGFCYIECASAEDANRAIETLNNHQCGKERLVVELSSENISRMRNMFTATNWGVRNFVVVTGLDTSAKEDMIQKSIREHFAECNIVQIRVASQGRAYLDFGDHDSFCKAMDLDGSSIDGHDIQVIDVKSKQPSGPGFLCVLCGGTGLTCTTCGASIGGKCGPGISGWIVKARTDPGDSGQPPNSSQGSGLGGSDQAGIMNQTSRRQAIQKRTVFVGRLRPYLGKEQAYMRDVFSTCGAVTDISVPVNHDGTSKGYCFITFEDEQAAIQALKLNGKSVEGMKIKVNGATSKSLKQG